MINSNGYSDQKPADRLTSVRCREGLSVRKLAKKTGVNRAKISRWENGESLKTIREAIEVANELGESVEELFQE